MQKKVRQEGIEPPSQPWNDHYTIDALTVIKSL